MSGFIDTHAHLHDRAFNEDRPAVLARTRAAGLEAVITVGTDVTESEAALALARGETDVYATVGLHPHDARLWTSEVRDRLGALAADGRVVGVGEIGLDLYRNLSPPDAQERAFREQLALANALTLPVVIHCREAEAETFAILREWAPGARCGDPVGVLHCYSGDADLAARYAALGFVISFAGPVTYPKNAGLREAARTLPAERMALETDCPYLAPQVKRGRRNEPAYVVETARVIAALRGVRLETLAAQTSANARRLFRLPVPERVTP